MENKVVFLKVFGWDCTFCMKEVPELIKLKNSLPEAFDVIAIEAQEHSADEAKKFIEEYGINYPIVLVKVKRLSTVTYSNNMDGQELYL